ncbi:prolyl 3-hydroxylase 1-like [Argiope bruennichi]|uniref:procollagen-proline 3-dioxygenase n=1 Tax=Argiope bruennichi TaxID=94029 RepID=A0A8T0EV77_ARGBR|nr:prolyl 3-hydroxylase 1-like [Argiope bruennichi]KAF8782020.1 Prolyl 3-hydroxylase 1 like protein [Argiope bruennichi]
MNYISLIIFILLFSLSTSDEISLGNSKINYEKLYKVGVDAYLENRWRDCAILIEKSIDDYIYYNTIIIRCRKKCQTSSSDLFFNETDSSVDLWHLQTLVTDRALCLMRCHNMYFPNRPKTSKETDDLFEKKVPYNYLQLCYFKIEEHEKAASCAYTFLIHNPGHEVMQANLQYYMALPDMKVENVKYLEPKNYQDLFLKGAQLYMEGEYNDSIEVMEMSLREYLAAEEECRLNCEGPLPQISNEELYIAITNHFTYALRCKLRCPEKLSYMYGQKHDQLFTMHYHYLQFNYYKVGKLKEACSAVASYLLFYPNDETMHANKEYYSKQPGVLEEWFTPRKEVIEYHWLHEREIKLLKAIEHHFQFKTENQSVSQSLMPPPGSKKTSVERRKLGKSREKLTKAESSEWFKKYGISPLMNENNLNGTKRVTLSNLASKEECQKLLNLAMEGAVHGDGYNGRESPHTEFEMFEGLTVARAALLAHRGLLNPAEAQLFLNISEKARQAVEVYFNLETELFFSYTHLVCRTALPDSPDIRDDLSHPIHADNCVLMSNGKCLKEKPAYTWRDYSSIVYLNDDFEGGEFIFAKEKNNVEASIKPSCGLMVAFSAGKENLHGVKAVRKGRRCALAMWYTLDSEQREKERDFAEVVLDDLWKKRELANRTTSESNISKSTLNKFAELAKKGNDMHNHSEL